MSETFLVYKQIFHKRVCLLGYICFMYLLYMVRKTKKSVYV
jgi:hypothetical protein